MTLRIIAMTYLIGLVILAAIIIYRFVDTASPYKQCNECHNYHYIHPKTLS